ncbi:hypothetical protein [Actinoplanes xinjiangensis]|nr:hypothetical protein [Actinoplanes xinjiangensis]
MDALRTGEVADLLDAGRRRHPSAAAAPVVGADQDRRTAPGRFRRRPVC